MLRFVYSDSPRQRGGGGEGGGDRTAQSRVTNHVVWGKTFNLHNGHE